MSATVPSILCDWRLEAGDDAEVGDDGWRLGDLCYFEVILFVARLWPLASGKLSAFSSCDDSRPPVSL